MNQPIPAASTMPAMELHRDRATFVLIDIQERMMKAIPAQAGARVVKTTQVLIEAGRAAALGKPRISAKRFDPSDRGDSLSSGCQ